LAWQKNKIQFLFGKGRQTRGLSYFHLISDGPTGAGETEGVIKKAESPIKYSKKKENYILPAERKRKTGFDLSPGLRNQGGAATAY